MLASQQRRQRVRLPTSPACLPQQEGTLTGEERDGKQVLRQRVPDGLQVQARAPGLVKHGAARLQAHALLPLLLPPLLLRLRLLPLERLGALRRASRKSPPCGGGGRGGGQGYKAAPGGPGGPGQLLLHRHGHAAGRHGAVGALGLGKRWEPGSGRQQAMRGGSERRVHSLIEVQEARQGDQGKPMASATHSWLSAHPPRQTLRSGALYASPANHRACQPDPPVPPAQQTGQRRVRGAQTAVCCAGRPRSWARWRSGCVLARGGLQWRAWPQLGARGPPVACPATCWSPQLDLELGSSAARSRAAPQAPGRLPASAVAAAVDLPAAGQGLCCA